MSVYVHHGKDGKVDHLQCDDHQHRVFHSFDEEPDFSSEGRADEELAKLVSDAVCDALREHRKAKDARRARDDERTEGRAIGETEARSSSDRAGNMTTQNDRAGKDALPDRQDHREDFRVGDRRPTVDSALGYDSSGRFVGIDRRALLGLN